MAKILLAWEFGGGLGHVGPLRAIGVELVRRGHTVTLATTVGNIELSRQAFAHTGIAVIPAPTLPASDKRLKFPCTYSDVLHDCGYSSAENVATIVGEWLKLFDWVQPELMVADFCPTAMVASCLRNFKTAAAGIGFACPPDTTPLPSLRKEIPEPHWAVEVEQTVLNSMNHALAAGGGKPLVRVTEIFSRVDSVCLLTLEELDQYNPWRNATRETKFWPPVVTLPGPTCSWPAGAGVDPASPRVFVYLRDNQVLLPILQGLAYKKISTVCVAPRFGKHELANFKGTSVLVSTTPIELRGITSECNLAVLNGGHGTVCEFLRAGVPLLLLPTTLEQQVTGNRLQELGAGCYVASNDLNEIGATLEELLSREAYKDAARTVSKKYGQKPEQEAVEELVDELLGDLLIPMTK